MLRTKPKLTYKGLTIILSNPSRFDNINLLSAGAGHLVNDCLKPDLNLAQCDIRLKDDETPFLENTKVILLLGQQAANRWARTTDNSIGEIRGSIFYTEQGQIPIIPTFFPQDACDIVNHEKHYNEQNEIETTEEAEDEESATSEKRRHGRTKRKNYRFWIEKDIAKCRQLLKNNGVVPKRLYEPQYILHPDYDTVRSLLLSHKHNDLFIDLETYWPDPYLKCIGFSFNCGEPIYVVPFYLPDNSLAYSNMFGIAQAFATAFKHNRVIAYNGAGFDFIILPWKCGIPVGKNLFDPMIAHHRCYSDVEKSLGHATSLWTWEPFHKDEGACGYSNMMQAKQTFAYCGKDVFTMQLVTKAIMEYAARIPGLTASINDANDAIYAYLCAMLQGMEYDVEMLLMTIHENDRLMNHYLSWLDILIGKDTCKKLRGKGKSGMPGSNKQCVEYFHEMLGYPIVGRGSEKKDGTRGPSLGKKNMYKLKLKHENPVIDICLAYRELSRESGSLGFKPWKE